MNDFLFGNNNKSIVKKLAYKSLKADKRRRWIIIVTITFTTVLLSSLCFYLSAQKVELEERIRGHYQAGCVDISQELIHTLSESPKVEQWGVAKRIGFIRYQDTNLSVLYEDENQMKLAKRPPIEGNLPEKETEIMVEQDFLEYFNLPQSAGQTLLLDLGDGVKQEYTITGIMQNDNDSRSFMVLLSKAYVIAHSPEKPVFEFRFRFADDNTENKDVLKNQIRDFLLANGVPEDKIFYSSNYFGMIDVQESGRIVLYVVGALLLIACSVVIYNIFYISVAGKIRVYGRLKAIGATTKQLKGIVRRETMMLLLYAVPVGVLIAGVIIFAMKPEYWDWKKNLQSSLGVAIVMFLAVAASTRVPIRLAGRVSAIEAVRSNPYSDKSKSVSSRLHRRITPVSLAGMNFERNRKKSVFTFISLGLTAIMFMCIASLAVSIDVNSMASYRLSGGNYMLTLKLDDMEEEQTLLKENPLNENLYKRLASLDAVNSITRYNSSYIQVELPKKTAGIAFTGLTENQMGKFFPENFEMEGTAEYSALLKQNGVIVGDNENLLGKLYGYSPQIGEILHCSSFDGQSMELPVLGIAKGTVNPAVAASFFYVTDETLKQFYPETNNFNTAWYIYADYDSDTLRKNIFEVVDDARIDITSQQDIADRLQPSLDQSIKAAYILTTFLFVFALINLINTLMTNLIARQQELSILQSIGMSFRQMAVMLSAECLWYVVITLIIAITAGGAVGMLLCSKLNQIGVFGVMTYRFPLLEAAVFTAVLMVIQLCYSVVAVRYMKKQPLLERVNAME